MRKQNILFVSKIVEYKDNNESKTIIWFLVGSGICAICALMVIICWRQCTSKTNKSMNINDAIGLEYLLDPNDQQNMTLQDPQIMKTNDINDGATQNLWGSPYDDNEIMDDYNKIKTNNPNIENEINTKEIENEIKNIVTPTNDDNNNNNNTKNDKYNPPDLNMNKTKKSDDILLGDSINNSSNNNIGASTNSINLVNDNINEKTKLFSRLSQDLDDATTKSKEIINNNNDKNEDDIDLIIKKTQLTINDANNINDIDISPDIGDNPNINVDVNVNLDENIILSDNDQGYFNYIFCYIICYCHF